MFQIINFLNAKAVSESIILCFGLLCKIMYMYVNTQELHTVNYYCCYGSSHNFVLFPILSLILNYNVVHIFYHYTLYICKIHDFLSLIF